MTDSLSGNVIAANCCCCQFFLQRYYQFVHCFCMNRSFRRRSSPLTGWRPLPPDGLGEVRHLPCVQASLDPAPPSAPICRCQGFTLSLASAGRTRSQSCTAPGALDEEASLFPPVATSVGGNRFHPQRTTTFRSALLGRVFQSCLLPFIPSLPSNMNSVHLSQKERPYHWMAVTPARWLVRSEASSRCPSLP